MFLCWRIFSQSLNLWFDVSTASLIANQFTKSCCVLQTTLFQLSKWKLGQALNLSQLQMAQFTLLTPDQRWQSMSTHGSTGSPSAQLSKPGSQQSRQSTQRKAANTVPMHQTSLNSSPLYQQLHSQMSVQAKNLSLTHSSRNTRFCLPTKTIQQSKTSNK